ncbi:CDP-alcohol phosphatidyltransferase family protein [Candidatus Saccharibacteria bacterium]|nr:CDP-alcohol phosphatidyltransferase family protein [Candidatus Saccharibacteria bacterium]
MKVRKPLNVQRTLDGFIDKLFLWFIPHRVRPNQVTVLRFMLTPVVYWLFVNKLLVAGLVVFTIAACTDFIDGAMARTRDQITDLGKMLDPVADKLLILSVLVVLGMRNPIVMVFSVFIVLEIVAVLAGYFLQGTFGKPIGSNVFGKCKLILQAFSIGLFMIGTLMGNRILIDTSIKLLIVAFVLALTAGVEVARQKFFSGSKSTDEVFQSN